MRRLACVAFAVLCLVLTSRAVPAELVEASAAATPDFVHFNGMAGDLLFPEMTGQGGALFDFDGDGDLDLYLVQGARLTPQEAAPAEARHLDVLLRNDATESGPRWVDVTHSSGLRADGYGMAVAVGDVDQDGWSDLFVGNYGANQLWRNRGDGTFEDFSAGLEEVVPRWTTGAVFVDLDGDSMQDLYIVNYVEYDVAEAPACYASSSRRDYCGPSGFPPQPDRLLRNLGGGRFAEVSGHVGLGSALGAGLGVAVLDADGDGGLDLYVANDGQPNFLWRREGPGMVDDALLAGVAVNRRGEPEASMGIAVGDFDRDGDEDLFLTHLDGESNTLYVSSGNGLFDDRTIEHGLAAPSIDRTAFGVAWVDLDHDGWLDLAVVNGAVRIQEDQAVAGDPYPLSQSNQLFASRGGNFLELEHGPFAAAIEVSRGLVDGDIDNDGDRDLLVLNNSGPARLFLNTAAEPSNWLGVSAPSPNHQRVVASYPDSRVVSRLSTSGSYASAVDSRVVVAGGVPADSLELHSGRLVRVLSPPLGHYLRFDLGSSPNR